MRQGRLDLMPPNPSASAANYSGVAAGNHEPKGGNALLIVGIFVAVDIADLLKNDDVARLIVLDDVEKGLHQHDPSTAGPLEVFVSRWVGNFLQDKTVPFVFNFNPDLFLVDAAINTNALRGIHCVAMLDRVDERLLKRKAHPEHIPGGIVPVLEELDDTILDFLSRRRFARYLDLKNFSERHNLNGHAG